MRKPVYQIVGGRQLLGILLLFAFLGVFGSVVYLLFQWELVSQKLAAPLAVSLAITAMILAMNKFVREIPKPVSLKSPVDGETFTEDDISALMIRSPTEYDRIFEFLQFLIQRGDGEFRVQVSDIWDASPDYRYELKDQVLILTVRNGSFLCGMLDKLCTGYSNPPHGPIHAGLRFLV